MELERKIYQDLLEWKNRSGGKSVQIREVYDYVWTEDNS